MPIKRLLLSIATIIGLFAIPICVWGQNYPRTGHRGFIANELDLPREAAASPVFRDQQHDRHRSMSPDSWGQSAPLVDTIAPAIGVQGPIAHTASNPFVSSPTRADRVLERSPAIAIEVPRGIGQSTPINASDVRSNPFVQPPVGGSPVQSQANPFSQARYPRLQQERFDILDLKAIEENNKSETSIFPFTGQSPQNLTAPPRWEAPATPTKPDLKIAPGSFSELSTLELAPSQGTPASPQNDLGTGSGNIQSFAPEIGSFDRSPDPNFGEPALEFHSNPSTSASVVVPSEQRPIHPAYSSPTYDLPQLNSPTGFQYPTQPSFQQPVLQQPAFEQPAFEQPTTSEFPAGSVFPVNQQPTGGAHLPNFRSDLGHRDALPTIRNQQIHDDGKKFDHETKKRDYPPPKEIIATGKFFYNAEVNVIRPSFLGNTGLSIDQNGFSESVPFDFSTEYAPNLKFGFESRYGPGIELSYFNLTANARELSATHDGVNSAASIASVTGPGRLSTIETSALGDTLTANHSFDLETIGFNFFKELKFPISRLNGKFGFLYANVAQSLLADVTDASGAINSQLSNTTDFRGYGPQFALEYFRPVGHTPLTLVTSFGGKGLFGRRDQFLSNDTDVVARRFGADEFITVIDFAGGIQLKKLVADQRYLTAKIGYVHQSWLGGGTAVDPQGDFGISGFVFGVGYNR